MNAIRPFYDSLLRFPKILNALEWLNQVCVFETIAMVGALLTDAGLGNKLSPQRLLVVGGGGWIVTRISISIVKNNFQNYAASKKSCLPKTPTPPPQPSSLSFSPPDAEEVVASSLIPLSTFLLTRESELSADKPLIHEIERLLPESDPLRVNLQSLPPDHPFSQLLQNPANQLDPARILPLLPNPQPSPPPFAALSRTPSQILDEALTAW